MHGSVGIFAKGRILGELDCYLRNSLRQALYWGKLKNPPHKLLGFCILSPEEFCCKCKNM
jgi:hypothetical protein